MTKPLIVIGIPSNKPDIIQKYALSVYSLTNLKPMLEKFDVSFALTITNVFSIETLNLIQARLEEKGFGYRGVMIPQNNPYRHAFAIHCGLTIFPDAFAYILWDDNMEASSGTRVYFKNSGRRYLECLDYLIRFPKCGGVVCKGTRGGNHSNWEIRPTNKMLYTERGCIFRNIDKGRLYDEKILEFPGPGVGNASPILKMLEKGYYGASQYNNPTRHHDRQTKDWKYPENDFGLHNRSLMHQLDSFVFEKYQCSEWRQPSNEGANFYPPENLLKIYRSAGGEPHIYEGMKTRPDLHVNYDPNQDFHSRATLTNE